MNDRLHQGTILSCESLDIKGFHQIHIYGREDIGPFRIIITDNRPLFFIPRGQSTQDIPFASRKPLDLKSPDHQNVDALYFKNLHDFFRGRDLLKEKGLRSFEADIYPSERYLMERFINNSIEFKGPSVLKGKIREFINPQIRKLSHYQSPYRIASIDIETSSQNMIYSIAIHGYSFQSEEAEFNKVLINSDKSSGVKEQNQYCLGEKGVLQTFLAWIKSYDPDIIIGWYVIGFDLEVIKQRCLIHKIPFTLGRDERVSTLSEGRGSFQTAKLSGRIVLDGIQVLKQNFFHYPSYKLESVAQDLLGRGKDIGDDNKVEEINRRYREDKEALAFYNIEDCHLVSEIFQKAELIELLNARRIHSGMSLDRVNLSIPAFDHFYLPPLHRKGFVASNTKDIIDGEKSQGAYVFSNKPGIYKHVIVLDFKSLYPTIMRTFFIDPLALQENRQNPSETPVGITFSRTEHILPDFLKSMMDAREEAKKEKNKHKSLGIKILMNSFYGVMGTTKCRFFNPSLPTAITQTGQWALKQALSWLEQRGYEVLCGDTDSLFISLTPKKNESVDEIGETLALQINSYLSKLIMKEFDLFSSLEIEYEKHYSPFFLPSLRGGSEGARKRYTGMLCQGPLKTLEFKGMENIRSDWTDLAKDFQYTLFKKIFYLYDPKNKSQQSALKEEISQWIKDFITDLEEGQKDNQLIFTKGLSKSPQEYTKTVPPHIKAAKKLPLEKQNSLRKISYIHCIDGPHPIDLKPQNPDYSFYIEKQLKPLALDILPYIDIDFDSLLSGYQLSLF